MANITQTIAHELNVREQQIDATITLLDGGATVPFIARYRKEITGGLDDGQLRTLFNRLGYLRDLNDRREVILSTIKGQGKLTPQLHEALVNADNKRHLEDLYLPFKPKRQTKSKVAIKAGIEPLVDKLLGDYNGDPAILANEYINAKAGFEDSDAVLEGARFILMERLAEDADILQKVRRHISDNAILESRVVAGKEQKGAKFSDYFARDEKLLRIPSHRALAMLRGRNEGVLRLTVNADPNNNKNTDNRQGSYCEVILLQSLPYKLAQRPVDQWLKSVVNATWKLKLAPQMATEFIARLREAAESEAINVFARNLTDLLMAAPAGAKTTLGLDPGLRTGVKVAVVDNTGKLVAHSTIFPHAPQKQWQKSLQSLANMVKMHKVELIAIGNGTASRETDKLVTELLEMVKTDMPKLTKAMVSEAGASVYSASELAAEEFPDINVSIRGAVSIARRLQDPLAELVKIEPKAIGVGQYQHDVNQSQLSQALAVVVEDCVNGVGVDVNMASTALLAQVAGLNKTLAANIVGYRDNHGQFSSREQLLNVSRLGPKAYEQAAGFLRINNGVNPLDGSAVHPEAYAIVETIAKTRQQPVKALIGNSELLAKVDAKDLITPQFGLPTINDILLALDKLGRDPRGDFKTAVFKEGIDDIKHLKPGMILEGVVTNVTKFGAFVDVGVHQDGLVHISSLTDKFVSDPHAVVKAGEVVKVKVINVDADRKRIGLSMRLDRPLSKPEPKPESATPQAKATRDTKPAPKQQQRRQKPPKQPANAAMGNAFADAFAKLKE